MNVKPLMFSLCHILNFKLDRRFWGIKLVLVDRMMKGEN